MNINKYKYILVGLCAIVVALQSHVYAVCGVPESSHSIESIKGVVSRFLSQFSVQHKSYGEVFELISSAKLSLWNSSDISVKTSESEFYDVWSIDDWNLYFWDTNLKRITYTNVIATDVVAILSIDIMNEQVHYYGKLRDMGDRSNEGVYFITDWAIYIKNKDGAILRTITREDYWKLANVISLPVGNTNSSVN